VLAWLARKACYPAALTIPLLHIDTGQNFPETIAFRDRFASELGCRLDVRRVQDSIDSGRVKEEAGPNASRNRLQTVTLIDAIAELGLDGVFGGARRDEEKARAKERVFSHRDRFGQWDPRQQRPELWQLFNARKNPGEHFRIFPLSNWTELDLAPLPHEPVTERLVRFRTVGDATGTGAIESSAATIAAVLDELRTARLSERGTRYDDQRSDAAMEDRKREGYF
jgi:sulfate adenylyltransferase subunit 2